MKQLTTIFASSRENGDTLKVLTDLLKDAELKNDIIDLGKKNISYFDYDHKNKDDDFVTVIEDILSSGSVLFCTPVYWYSMSAQLKTFFDRFSDLITIRKDLGRSLKGVKVYLLYCGASAVPPEYFAKPVIDTCNYLEMDYKGELYCSVAPDGKIADDQLEKIEEFKKFILED